MTERSLDAVCVIRAFRVGYELNICQRVHTLFVLLCLISFFCDRKSIYEYLKTKKNESELRSLVLGLFALCSMVGMAQEAEADDTGYIVKVGQVAPDFTVTLTDGRTVTLSDFRGKVVMLQFTASWCGVCRKEMPFIEKDNMAEA